MVRHTAGATINSDNSATALSSARTDPTPVFGTLRFTSIAAGVAHTCGKTTDGSVACWGSNLGGELGDKSAAIRIVPRFVVLGVIP